MLADKDRIFTNLYGWSDAGLAGAKKRGDWDNTAAILALGHDAIVEEMKASGLRGRGGCRFSNRSKMVVHAKGGWCTPALSGCQCR